MEEKYREQLNFHSVPVSAMALVSLCSKAHNAHTKIVASFLIPSI